MKPEGAPLPSNDAMDLAQAAPGARGAVDDAVLVAQAQAGDPSAFRVLVERHQDHAYGLALRMLRRPEDARDVAQESFVRAWLSIGSFRGDAAFGTWLHRIVMRRALDRSDMLRRRGKRETGLDEAGELAAAGEEPAARERARRLETHLSRLTDAQRAVVTLFYWEGCSVEEVAHTLGMPAGTVKTHLSRARATLRESWLNEERSGT